MTDRDPPRERWPAGGLGCAVPGLVLVAWGIYLWITDEATRTGSTDYVHGGNHAGIAVAVCSLGGTFLLFGWIFWRGPTTSRRRRR